MMKALVYKGNGKVAVEDIPKPTIEQPTDAVVRMLKTTICGTDLHIQKGDVSACQPGLVLGHEGVGIIEEVGGAINRFKKGDRVLIICMTQCGICEYCRRGMMSHCKVGGWVLGKTSNGCQAEYVRIPYADTSLFPVPQDADTTAMVMVSDIFPTGLECGVQNARVHPGGTVAIVGSGPIGLGALLCAQMYSPAKIIMIDMDNNRLQMAGTMGATHVVNSGAEDAVAKVMEITKDVGCDSVIEAVGIPPTFELCQKLLAPGGALANIGVHGSKVDLDMEALWDRNITITTRLVDTVSIPMLAGLVNSGRLDATKLITHHFKADEMDQAYETFGTAAKYGALKVLIDFSDS